MIESGDGWFVAGSDGAAQGPMSRAQLQSLRDQGKIGDDHLVWTLRQAEWVPLRRALGQKSSTSDAPPLPPTRKAETKRAIPKPMAKAASKSTARPDQSQKQHAIRTIEIPTRSSDQAWTPLTMVKAAPVSATDSMLQAEKGRTKAQTQERAAEGMRRLVARQIDLALLGGFSWAMCSAVGLRTGFWKLGSFGQEMESSMIAAFLLLVLLAIPLEALMVGFSGYTPGRLLLGLRVVDRHRTAPGVAVALQRAGRVALTGQALMIPPFMFIAWAIALAKLSNSGLTHWDQALNLSVRAEPIPSNQWWFALAALIGAWVMLLDAVWMRLVQQIMIAL